MMEGLYAQGQRERSNSAESFQMGLLVLQFNNFQDCSRIKFIGELDDEIRLNSSVMHLELTIIIHLYLLQNLALQHSLHIEKLAGNQH